MAFQTFREAFEKDNQAFEIEHDGKTYEGFFANIRVDRDTLPDGWYAYDLMDADADGNVCEIRDGYVRVNHFGTFCTRDRLPLNAGESLFYDDGRTDGDAFEYSYGEGRMDAEIAWGPAEMPETERIAKIRSGDAYLHNVPERLRTRAVCMAAVETDGNDLRFVPKSVLDAGICLAAVRDCGWELEDVPAEMRTREVCLAAVSSYWMAVRLLPEDILDEEICLAAVRKSGMALGGIPWNLRTERVCAEAMRKEKGHPGASLAEIPEELRSKEMCLAVVSGNGPLLRLVPEGVMDGEICLAAVRNDGMALKFVPKGMRTKEICEAAAEENPKARRYFPRMFADEKLAAPGM